ncbi:hypothetical protein GYH30_043335 [Glycine max]|uniref:F-box domain-containing protein n=2 Tax=Glycine subgen. Soja TaxID=1462606 RepID=A0A0R0GGH9_SOYBN|nr:hypothetical protein GYH30_043335 [Glycine max]RZB66045.1 hypothetical protein D0Y65_041915 [Glycine soja]
MGIQEKQRERMSERRARLRELQEIMDSILGVEIKKSKKSNHEGPNKISYLSDVIIGRILFFLPNKDTVRTSILSKRWM